jgi:hypothetical protein
MAGKIPGPYVNEVKQDDALMVYVNDGDFAKLDVGARRSGLPGDAKSSKMGIDHVGASAGRK